MQRILITTILALITSMTLAAPEPAVVQGPGLWTLDTEFKNLEPFRVQVEKNKGKERFWYIILTVTNETNQEVGFYPRFDLMTDTYKITAAGKNVPNVVYDRLKQRYQRTYPFLQTLAQAGDKMLQGENNAKDLLIVWPDIDPQANALKVFISGLSNETAVVEHPTKKTDNGDLVKIYLRKTLELNYNIGGDPAISPVLKVTYQGKDWIMR